MNDYDLVLCVLKYSIWRPLFPENADWDQLCIIKELLTSNLNCFVDSYRGELHYLNGCCCLRLVNSNSPFSRCMIRILLFPLPDSPSCEHLLLLWMWRLLVLYSRSFDLDTSSWWFWKPLGTKLLSHMSPFSPNSISWSFDRLQAHRGWHWNSHN